MEKIINEINAKNFLTIFGMVEGVKGLIIFVKINSSLIHVGARCIIQTESTNKITENKITGEVIGFDKGTALVMVYHYGNNINPGCLVYFYSFSNIIYPDNSWIGRVLNGLGEPIDNKGPLTIGNERIYTRNQPPISHKRHKVCNAIDVGVKAINTFLTCCRGQRIGIFAGSGVGKSVLLSQLARFTACDVCVIGLIGERGREVKEFIEDTLGEDGLKRSIIIVATSDETPLMRKEASYLTLAISEYFRDQGLSVLCLMDSVTRFAMALREIGLSLGELPTAKGYTPSVFAELPKLLERAGPGEINISGNNGSITGFFTVLVDGDDHNEPIADTVRSILDGHIVLDRSIANKGQFPPINILKSVSRTTQVCHNAKQKIVVREARSHMAIYEDMADMIRLGAYQMGTSLEIDNAINFNQKIISFLTQDFNEYSSLDESFQNLEDLLT